MKEKRIDGCPSVDLLWVKSSFIQLSDWKHPAWARACVFLLKSEHREGAFGWPQHEVETVVCLSCLFSAWVLTLGYEKIPVEKSCLLMITHFTDVKQQHRDGALGV